MGRTGCRLPEVGTSSRARVRFPPALSMKLATILDEGSTQFALEYDSTVGRKNQTRLDAVTYEKAQ